MKKLSLVTAIISGLLLSTSAYAITVTGNASAIIRRNIAATETQTMNFGTISSNTTAGTVTCLRRGLEHQPCLITEHLVRVFLRLPENRPPR